MAGRPRWRFWARGALIAAIAGHWLGNAICDRAEYLDAGWRYTWRASLPILIQTVVVAMVIAGLGLVPDRPFGGRAHARLRGGALLATLLASQIALFLVLEGTERIIQGPFAEGGFLASGLVLELLFAIAGALVLLALGSVALRAIRSIRRLPPTARVRPRIVVPVRRVVRARVVSGPLVRRAPPLPV